jgi:Arc/MetJ-type ribon-helix-helix transcriptional regulator
VVVASAEAVMYDAEMTITLTPEQQKKLEAAVAAGQFKSVEEAVRVAADHLIVADTDLDALSWAKPYVDEAHAEIVRGDAVSLEEFRDHIRARLSKSR